MRHAWAIVLLLVGAPAAAGPETPRLGLDVLVGAPVNVGTRMDVRQDGAPDLAFDASFRSDALEAPIYWAVRLTRRRGADSWSVELMHHKVRLADPPAEIQSFAISHGFNFLTLQRAWRSVVGDVRVGGGVIVAHPESTVRGRAFDERGGPFGGGYHLAGPTALIGVTREIEPWRGVAVAAEVRASAAPVVVPIAGGEARFTNLALHAMLGLGFRTGH